MIQRHNLARHRGPLSAADLNHPATLLAGDVVGWCERLPADHFDTICTDPPYHLTQASRGGSARVPGAGPFGRHTVGTKARGFMGTTWDGGGVAFDPATWRAVLRVAKPGATLLAFGGTRTWHRLAVAIEDAGWQIRDSIMWLYGSGFPKSLDISKALDKRAGAGRRVVGSKLGQPGYHVRHSRGASVFDGGQGLYRDADARARAADVTAPATDLAALWDGWGTALKPAWEPIVVAMKPTDGTFADNARRHGVAGFNIDGGRIDGAPRTTHADGDHRKRLTSKGVKGGAWGNPNADLGASDLIYPARTGRWPANVLLDEAAADRLDAAAGERTSHGGGTSAGRGYGSTSQGVRAIPLGDTGGASRFFYTAKASKRERNAGLPEGQTNTHPTVKPLALMRYLLTLTATPTGGNVLDPFAGSFTTGVAAAELGRPFVGIDLSPRHVDIGRHRVGHALATARKSATKPARTPRAKKAA